MKTRTYFLWVLLAMLLGGVNGAWANTYTVKFSSGTTTQSTANWFSLAGIAYGIDYQGTYNNETYTNSLKVTSSTNISFTTTVLSTITIVQCVSRSSDDNSPLKFDNAALTGSQQTATEDGVYVEYTLTDVAAGNHYITRGKGQTGLFMVKVEEAQVTFTANVNDMFYRTTDDSGDLFQVGTQFSYVSSMTSLRVKLNLNMDIPAADMNTTNFRVESDNSSVLDASSYRIWRADVARVYTCVDVRGAGTATLTFYYKKGTPEEVSDQLTFTIIAFPTYNGTFPYTWDFRNNDWTSSRIQTKNNTTIWNYSDNEARAKDASGISANNNIDMINGLAFSSVASTSPCLDWTNRQLWLQAGTTITLPTLSAGQIVTLSSTGSFAVPSGTTKVGENTFRVTADNTTLTLTVPSGNCYLYSIKVSSAGQATYETTADGVFQFTGTGSLDGGTVIKDVPGLEAIIGSVGDIWTITNQNSSGYYKGYVGSGSDKDKTFIVFSPSVNGLLTIEGTFFGVSSHIYIDELETNTHVFDSSGERLITAQTCSTPLVAGKTYKLYGGFYSIQFHGFSYRPAFLTPDNTAEQTATYTVYSSETSFPMLVSEYTSGVTFTSSNTDAATVTEYTGWPTYVAAGTTMITGTVTSPNSSVNSKTATYTLTFQEANITSTLNFQTSTPAAINYIDYGSDISGHQTFCNPIVSAIGSDNSDALTGATITYSSSDTSIATVDDSGNLSIFNNGEVVITATMAAHGKYLQATQTYSLTINPTEASEMHLEHNSTAENPIVIPFGNGYTNKGTVYCGSVAHPEAYIFYSPEYASGSTALLTTNNEKGIVTPVEMDDTDANNVVAIRVHSDAYKQYTEATATYYIKIVQNTNVSLNFAPEASGYVNVDASITPYLNIGGVKGDKIGSLTATIDNACATVTTDLKTNWVLNPDGTVFKLNPVMTGVSTGTATITYTLADTKYYKGTTATYKLTVNASGTRNFRWNDDKTGTPEYKVFQGDFMLMPLIDGNSNANNSYSNHSNNKYLYQVSPKNSSPSSLSDFNLTYNDNDYRLNEGIPDFDILNADKSAVSDRAVIFLGKGEGGRTGEKPDTLLIYALPIGGNTEQTVYIRAYEPANHLIYCDAKLTIMPKATLTAAHTADVAAVHFPYTWDFTKDFGTSATAISGDNVYWTPVKDRLGTYQAGGGFFNIYSYAKPNDKTLDPKNRSIYFQNFVANGNTLPQFKGLMVCINGTSSWGNKVERLQVTPAAGEGYSHLFFNGGYHELQLPDVSTSNIVPDNYKLFIKVKGSGGGGKVTFIQGSTSIEKSFGATETTILDYDATKTGGQILLRFNNTHVYWIATSTEAKRVEKRTSTDYPAATYSYNEDLHFNYTNEANNEIGQLTPYYASSFSSGTVCFTRFDNFIVPAMNGVVLKGADNAAGGDYYMIANPRNVETYNVPTSLSYPTNLLKATTQGQTISRFESSNEYTNYVLASHYFKVYDEGSYEQVSGSEGDGPWRFVRVNNTFTNVDAKLAYLQVSGRQGNIDETYNAASRSLLVLVFDDEPDATGIQHEAAATNVVDGDAWYTLQGVRVTTPAKGGLYIHKGKKVAVK